MCRHNKNYTLNFFFIIILSIMSNYLLFSRIDFQLIVNFAIKLSQYNKTNDMSKSNSKLDNNCQHDYCPHLHYQSCRKYRQTHIPYTHRPTKQVDLTCNKHPKTLSALKTANISTLAMQRYLQNPILPDQEDTNFSKNFYLENIPDNFQLRNTMVKDLDQQIQTKNAYVLAIGARKDYENFAKQRQDYLYNARKRADIAFQNYYQNKKVAKEKLKQEQKRWITQYYRKVEELIEHIFAINQKNQEHPNLKDRLFVKQNQGNDSKKLGSFKIKEPQAALGLLQSMRALLLVKKIELEQVRRDQQHNKSSTVSQLDISNTSKQNVSAVSFISSISNATGKEEGQSHVAQKYCDFQNLQNKWGKNNVQQVRNTLRMMICRDRVNKAEGVQIRQKRQAKQKDLFLKKQMLKMLGKKNQAGIKQKTKKGKNKKQNDFSYSVNQKQDEVQQKKLIVNSTLSKQEQIVKQTLLRGGIFDSLGNTYQRNRNYSKVFRDRAQKSVMQLSFRQTSQIKKRPETARLTAR